MSKSFKIHDRVSWNSEAGRVSGTLIRVHTCYPDTEHRTNINHMFFSPDMRWLVAGHLQQFGSSAAPRLV